MDMEHKLMIMGFIQEILKMIKRKEMGHVSLLMDQDITDSGKKAYKMELENLLQKETSNTKVNF